MNDSQPPPSSSVVREAALAWHRDVRRALARGLHSIAEARAGRTDSDRLRASAAGIAAVVRRQVEAESHNLGPVLAQLDAWGPQRVAQMESAHRREEAALVHATDGDDPSTLATSLEASVREILRALRLEEKEVLDADLLDDTTTVSTRQSSG